MSGAQWARQFMSKRNNVGTISKPKSAAARSPRPSYAKQAGKTHTTPDAAPPQRAASAPWPTATKADADATPSLDAGCTDADIVREAEEGSAEGAAALLLRAQHRGRQPSAAAFQS